MSACDESQLRSDRNANGALCLPVMSPRALAMKTVVEL